MKALSCSVKGKVCYITINFEWIIDLSSFDMILIETSDSN